MDAVYPTNVGILFEGAIIALRESSTFKGYSIMPHTD